MDNNKIMMYRAAGGLTKYTVVVKIATTARDTKPSNSI